MNPIVEKLKREIEIGREFYTHASPTKRVKLLEVYPGQTNYEVIVEVVESEFGTEGAGNRLTLPASEALRALGY